MKKIKDLIAYNWKPLVGFQLIYKTASSLLFIPLLWGLFDVTMELSGYTYLTLENIVAFFTKPLTILALILILFLATFYAMIDISAVVFTLDQSAQKEKVHFRQIIAFSVRNARRAWNLKNILLVFVVLLLMPFLNAGMASGFLATISIPEFIMDYIYTTPLLLVLFVLAVVFFSFLMTR